MPARRPDRRALTPNRLELNSLQIDLFILALQLWSTMPVPDYNALKLPLLELAADGREHSLSEAADAIAEQLHLAPEDLKELVPSGAQTKFDNRVSWACTYLKKAVLLESAGRGRFRITQRGLEVLSKRPNSIDNVFLSQFPEFVAFKQVRNARPKTERLTPEMPQEEQTPEERLDGAYETLRGALAQEILDRVRTCSPRFFEKLVVDLLVAMGYGGSRSDAGQAVGTSGDGGIDGIIKEDKLGLDAVYIQAKRWEASVGRPIVQAFAGSLEGQRARKGVMITTSQFTNEASDYVGRIEKKIVLIDGEQLAELMIDHGVGVSEISRYTIKKIDLDYFGEP